MVKAVIFDMYETLITHYKTPLYFGSQILTDMKLGESEFRNLWDPTESDRSTGKLSFEEVIETILTKNNIFSQELFDRVVFRRKQTKDDCFNTLHPNIIPMLEMLKENGILIGLISNCFSEEVIAIKKSVLYPYFDAPFLSYEEGVQKPDIEIFERCISKLGVSPVECVYVGDGGSYELETARSLGMNAVQAVWYFDNYPGYKKPDFLNIKDPLDIIKLID